VRRGAAAAATDSSSRPVTSRARGGTPRPDAGQMRMPAQNPVVAAGRSQAVTRAPRRTQHLRAWTVAPVFFLSLEGHVQRTHVGEGGGEPRAIRSGPDLGPIMHRAPLT